MDMIGAIHEDICNVCGKGKMVFSPVLLHQSFGSRNKSFFQGTGNIQYVVPAVIFYMPEDLNVYKEKRNQF